MQTRVGTELDAPGDPRARVALAIGAVLAAVLWMLNEPLELAAAWLAFGAWTVWRARASATPRLPLLALVGGASGGVVLLAPHLPQWALAGCLVIGAGVAPAHLWLESLRRSLARDEFALVLVAQPFAALLHGFVHAYPDALEPQTLAVLQRVFVASALIHAGLALVRREPERVLGAVIQSQSALVIAGAAAGETGWEAARMLLASTMGSGLVLTSIASELRRRFGALDAASHHALAEAAPKLHRLFVVCGWTFVGLPGGLAFFAEDLLFHALVDQSVGATVGFIVAAGFNAIAFYRLYLALFTGPAVHPPHPTSATASWKIAGLTLAVLALLVLGLLPSLLVSHGG